MTNFYTLAVFLSIFMLGECSIPFVPSSGAGINAAGGDNDSIHALETNTAVVDGGSFGDSQSPMECLIKEMKADNSARFDKLEGKLDAVHAKVTKLQIEIVEQKGVIGTEIVKLQHEIRVQNANVEGKFTFILIFLVALAASVGIPSLIPLFMKSMP